MRYSIPDRVNSVYSHTKSNSTFSEFSLNTSAHNSNRGLVQLGITGLDCISTFVVIYATKCNAFRREKAENDRTIDGRVLSRSDRVPTVTRGTVVAAAEDQERRRADGAAYAPSTPLRSPC